MLGKVLIAGQLKRGRLQRCLQALLVQLAVARDEHADELFADRLAVFIQHARVVDLHHHAFEGVAGFGGVAVDKHPLPLRPLHERRNRLGGRGVVLDRLRQAVVRARLRCDGGHGLHVGRVIARGGDDEGVLAVVGVRQKLLGRGAAHRTGGGLADLVAQPHAVEDALVGGAVVGVGLVQTFVGHVEGVTVLHHKLAPAQDAGAGARLVAVLRLNLVQRDREVLVGGVQVLHRGGEHLLVGGPEQHVRALAVLQAEQIVAVFGPAVGGLVRLAGKQCREEQLLAAHGVHLLADHALDLAQRAQAQRQPGVHAGGGATHIACAHQQLVAGHFGIGGIFAQRAQEQRGQACNHGLAVYR